MVSLILPLTRFEPALLETLAACVPAVAEGLIREALVVGSDPSPDLEIMIDAAGCRSITAQGDEWALLCAAAREARSDWLFVCTPGLVPLGAWIALSNDFLMRNDPSLIGVARLEHKGSWLARLLAQGRDAFGHFGSVPPLHGCLIHRSMLTKAEKAQRVALGYSLIDRRRG